MGSEGRDERGRPPTGYLGSVQAELLQAGRAAIGQARTQLRPSRRPPRPKRWGLQQHERTNLGRPDAAVPGFVCWLRLAERLRWRGTVKTVRASCEAGRWYVAFRVDWDRCRARQAADDRGNAQPEDRRKSTSASSATPACSGRTPTHPKAKRPDDGVATSENLPDDDLKGRAGARA